MSLRGYIFLTLLAALAIALAAESTVAIRLARQSVGDEMRKALDATDRIIENSLLSLPEQNGEVYLIRLVRSFDGNRNIRVELTQDDRAIAASQGVLPKTVPSWFIRVLDIAPASYSVQVPDSQRHILTLSPDPANELAENWQQFRDSTSALAFLDFLVLAFLYLALRHAAGPLRELKKGFDRLGQGRYEARVPPAGPSELKGLAIAFNDMADRLDRLEMMNARLQDQMALIQEEERADLARDLHDDMAPLLFAIRLDADRIEAHAAGDSEIAARARSIGDTVSRTQRHVRAMLQQLRPEVRNDNDLADSIESLAAFWRRFDRGVAVTLDIDGPQGTLDEAIGRTVFRVVQEGLTNAVRHGGAAKVHVAVSCDGESVTVSIEDDGRGIAVANGEGHGLTGMRERLAALGGQLRVQPQPGGGTRLKASIPLQQASV